jgi:gluconokinase
MSPRRRRVTTLVLMGVAGSGKSSVMAALHQRLGWPMLEGDELHPPANVRKMAAGTPLTDQDRQPWLQEIAGWIGERERDGTSSLVTCSALRRTYRDILRDGHPSVWFVHLDAPRSVLEARMERRTGHFMPASMLASQLGTLEPLGRDESGSTIDANAPVEAVADSIVERLRLA